jgi:hypothetical protein
MRCTAGPGSAKNVGRKGTLSDILVYALDLILKKLIFKFSMSGFTIRSTARFYDGGCLYGTGPVLFTYGQYEQRCRE